MSEFERFSEVIPQVWGTAELRVGTAPVHRLRRGRFAGGSTWDEADDLTRHRALILDIVNGSARTAERAVVSHVSAAVWHGLRLPAGVDLGRAHLTWPGSRGRRTTANVVPHRASIDAEDIVTLHGVRVTGVTRTIYDLARGHGPMVAVPAADSALAGGGASGRQFDDILLRLRGRPGSQVAAQVMSFADKRSAGAGPSQARVLLDQIGLPAPGLAVTIRHPHLGELIPVDFRFRGLHTCTSWHPGAIDGVSRTRPGLTETLAELRLLHLWLGPDDLARPKSAFERFSRAFGAALGPTRWHRRTPRLLPGPGG